MSEDCIKIHFLNVGHGDTTIIEFPSGRVAVIDLNDSQLLDEDSAAELAESFRIDLVDNLAQKCNTSAESAAKAWMRADGGSYARRIRELITEAYDISLEDPVTYLTGQLLCSSVFRFILTHPHMDHLSGLHRLVQQEAVTIQFFWDTHHSFSKDFAKEDVKGFDSNDWDEYERLQDNAAGSPKVIRNHRNDIGEFWTDDRITILSPTVELETEAANKSDPHYLSYVLAIKWGATKVILGGDANSEVWKDILDHYGEDFLSNTTIL